MKLPLSLCMIVRDEANMLPRCLESVRDLVSEIIVLDTGSTDDSAAIARSAGAHVERFAWRDDFAAARNASLAMATQSWIIVLDADEIIDRATTQDLAELLAEPSISALEVTIDNLNDRGPNQSFALIRIFRNLPEIRFAGAIHEGVATSVRHYNDRTGARVAASGLRIEHHGYLSDHIQRKGERNLTLIRLQRRHRPEDLYLRMKEYEELEKLGRRAECDQLIAETGELLIETPEAVLAELPYAPMIAANYAQLLLARGETLTALNLTEWALARFADEPWARYNRAVALKQMGDLDGAERAFRENLGLDTRARAYYVEPGIASWLAWFHLGEIALTRSDHAAAAQAIERTLVSNPGYPPALRRKVDIALARQDFQLALATILDILRTDSRDLWALVNGARILAALSLPEKAAQFARAALAIDPDQPAAREILANQGIPLKHGDTHE